jgi:hypothetical protein
MMVSSLDASALAISHRRMQHAFFSCYGLAKSHPEHLLIGSPKGRLEIPWSDEDTKWMKKVEDMVDGTNTGMDTFQLKPGNLKRDDLFCHMVQMRICDPTIKLHDPSP